MFKCVFVSVCVCLSLLEFLFWIIGIFSELFTSRCLYICVSVSGNRRHTSWWCYRTPHQRCYQRCYLTPQPMKNLKNHRINSQDPCSPQHTHRHTDRHTTYTHRQTGRQTHTHTDTQTHRQTDTERHTDRRTVSQKPTHPLRGTHTDRRKY